jgi:exodeoxyribonuclease VII large subunit
VVGRLSQALNAEFKSLFVEGELSNFKRPSSGHCYFTLKDSAAQIRCVMFVSNAERLRFRPADGMAVQLRGDLTVYPSRGDVQINVSSMEPAGLGDLQKAFAELGRRLKAEGIFDKARKRPLPAYPRTIGVITSGTGAAVRDILSVLGRRYPTAKVVVCPVLVQGDRASKDIVGAIREFNRLPTGSPQRPDLLILGRGGGSLEDLWAFNEEPTVRAVHASGIPIVAGIGHESDITLADLAADVRAATPSMAAELATPDAAELTARITQRINTHHASVAGRIRRARALLDRAGRVREYGHPAARLSRAQALANTAVERLEASAVRTLERAKLILAAKLATFRASDPLRPLDSGFALVESGSMRISRVSDVPLTAPFRIRFRDGAVRVTQDRNGPDPGSLMSPGSEFDPVV